MDHPLYQTQGSNQLGRPLVAAGGTTPSGLWCQNNPSSGRESPLLSWDRAFGFVLRIQRRSKNEYSGGKSCVNDHPGRGFGAAFQDAKERTGAVGMKSRRHLGMVSGVAWGRHPSWLPFFDECIR